MMRATKSSLMASTMLWLKIGFAPSEMATRRRKKKKNEEEKEKRIEESRIAIVLFSIKFVCSISCLDELVKIVECRSSNGLTLFPVFCDVDPSQVRKQNGSLEQAFTSFEEEEEKEKVERWRVALTLVANLSGWDLHASTGQEAEFIQKIVDNVVSIKRSRSPLNIASYLIGIDSRVASMLNSYIYRTSCEVRLIGICGISGLGKTTIAKAVYNGISHRFEGCSFLENVKEVSKQPTGLIQLQEQLLSDVLMKKNFKISNVARGINVIKKRLQCKRVLIVIDDVDHSDQLNALAIERDSFGMGSKIIVISRDEHFLNEAEVCDIYHPEELDSHESLRLFSWHAFNNNSPPDEYKELSKEIVGNVKGLPLAIEVMGSLMFGKRSLLEWENTLVKLKSTLGGQIPKPLRLSFYDLDDTEKDIFLDIACFFIGMDKSYVSKILDGCNLFPVIGIRELIQRSLITIDEDNKLRMHDLLREMAKKFIREESPEEPGRRTRLWSQEDVFDVLMKHKGTESVEGIILNISQLEDIVCFNTEAFVDMHNLRLLHLNYVHLRGGYEHLPKKLRWLCWHGFPLKSIPDNFDMEKLIVLHMENSSLEEVWKEIKLLKRLQILNLSHSRYLTKTPNLSEVTNLEELILEDCESLVEVHQSIGYLDKLIVLNLNNCHNLMKLPDSIGMLRSLEVLNLRGCSNQVQSTSWFSFPQCYLSSLLRTKHTSMLLPASFSGLCSLKSVNLNYCNLSEDTIPNDLWSLPLLKTLRLDGNRLCTLPDSIRLLSCLESLSLSNCRDLKLMRELPSSLKILDLGGCSTMEILPSNINDLSQLIFLNLEGCERLLSFPRGSTSSPTGVELKDIKSLKFLAMNYDHFCSRSDEISCLPTLWSLYLAGFEGSQTLPKLSTSLFTLFVEGETPTLLVNRGEIQSMETSNSVQAGIYNIEGCHHLGNTLRKNSIFQDIHREFQFWCTGSEIPEWMSHRNMGFSVSFEVSSDCSDCKIQGLDVSAVFLAVEGPGNYSCQPVIWNKTKYIQWGPILGPPQSTRPLRPGQDILMVRHITIRELLSFSIHKVGFGSHFEVGDQVEVSVEIDGGYGGSLQVKKCGVLLVQCPDEEMNLLDDLSLIKYLYDPEDIERALLEYLLSHSEEDLAVDGEVSELVHIEEDKKIKSGHNEGVESELVHIDEDERNKSDGNNEGVAAFTKRLRIGL
ncbi:disease resistance protein RUN1-like [Macadamia integrifolia]|uniref:disease resistance protein RUN1-like n=1 Tax=Macadamia integrifolia TaxID=60698 RepID=UPI001C4F837E|nr:disease resistance protein RUN1-like [Macadamia integrifolia]